LKERAVQMVAEVRADHDSEWAAMAKVSELLGVGTPETVRKWVRHPSQSLTTRLQQARARTPWKSRTDVNARLWSPVDAN